MAVCFAISTSPANTCYCIFLQLVQASTFLFFYLHPLIVPAIDTTSVLPPLPNVSLCLFAARLHNSPARQWSKNSVCPITTTAPPPLFIGVCEGTVSERVGMCVCVLFFSAARRRCGWIGIVTWAPLLFVPPKKNGWTGYICFGVVRWEKLSGAFKIAEESQRTWYLGDSWLYFHGIQTLFSLSYQIIATNGLWVMIEQDSWSSHFS